MITGKTYDYLKFLALIGLPALGTFYFTLAQIWDLPGGKEVVGTIVAIDTLLGAVLQLSSNKYNNSDEKYDGAINVIHTPNGGVTYELDLNMGLDRLENLEHEKAIALKVKPPKEPNPRRRSRARRPE